MHKKQRFALTITAADTVSDLAIYPPKSAVQVEISVLNDVP